MLKQSSSAFRRCLVGGLVAATAGCASVMLIGSSGAQSVTADPASALTGYLNAASDRKPVCSLLAPSTVTLEGLQYAVINYYFVFGGIGPAPATTTETGACENARHGYPVPDEGPPFDASAVRVRQIGDLAVTQLGTSRALLLRSGTGWLIEAETDTALGPADMQHALDHGLGDGSDTKVTNEIRSLLTDADSQARKVRSRFATLLARRRALGTGALSCTGQPVTVGHGSASLRGATLRKRGRTICIHLALTPGVLPIPPLGKATAGVELVPTHGKVMEFFAGLFDDGSVQVVGPGTPTILPLSRWHAARRPDGITLKVTLSISQARSFRSAFRWLAVLRGYGLPPGHNGERALPADVPPEADLRLPGLRQRLATYPAT
jgi:hypothetical protein